MLQIASAFATYTRCNAANNSRASLQGCNFRCPYCHNPELVDPYRYTPPWPEDRVAGGRVRGCPETPKAVAGSHPQRPPVFSLALRIQYCASLRCPTFRSEWVARREPPTHLSLHELTLWLGRSLPLSLFREDCRARLALPMLAAWAGPDLAGRGLTRAARGTPAVTSASHT